MPENSRMAFPDTTDKIEIVNLPLACKQTSNDLLLIASNPSILLMFLFLQRMISLWWYRTIMSHDIQKYEESFLELGTQLPYSKSK